MKLVVGQIYNCHYVNMEACKLEYGWENEYGLLVFLPVGLVRSGVHVPKGHAGALNVGTDEITYLVLSKDSVATIITE